MDCEIDDEFSIEIEVGDIGAVIIIDNPDTTVFEETMTVDIEPE